ncbi:hypothetical protein BSR29_02645 [Boudabousia liubingyangii]|uniref:2-hydroxyhepta-2,4-diene-1,7-dioate isomerase n=1 Tax=Boudabousia liubingyangii TaxID=1921764 RepID=A0A1Q5PMN0_9ACTO|nr:fumarylacetoacetate hydrolase family protein [Boudabousia liubingyangii]OKL47408.1 hypothetical protein BSR28_02505 [Boudabousia liubingyangii]OKL48779.1 hypothetical protein BSR29_02645 [Boudabousia liubingyangii]
MRVVRFEINNQIMFGAAEADSDQIVALKGDPLFDQVQPAGPIYSFEEVHLLSPVLPRSKVLGAADSYGPKGSGGAIPFFIKPNTSVIGPDDPILFPGYAEVLRGEVELGVVMKTMAKNLTPEEAKHAIMGYTIINDVTAAGPNVAPLTVAAKGFDTACVIGPWITVDPELDVDNLELSSSVDGETTQQGSTSGMRRTVFELVAEASSITTLLPGDVIATGSLAGAPELAAGKQMECAIAGLGSFRNPVLSR